MSNFGHLAAVVIGRNEGERLKRCIQSLQSQISTIVYVDSGSTDGSAEWAESSGVIVVSLDMSKPFTAARARNQGLGKLLEITPDVKYVQFIDGDCELHTDWLGEAANFLDANPNTAVVCGRRREKFPGASIYNQLCDIEWDTPVGEAKACGGDFLARVNVLQDVNGFEDVVIAGEEPELCFRIRQLGYRVFRLDSEMTLHDAAISKFSQWFKRARRCGYAYALGASMHGKSQERFRVTECRRVIIWAVLLPLIILGMAIFSPIFLLGILIYPAQMIRCYLKSKLPNPIRFFNAMFLVLGKFPEAFGVADFVFDRLQKNEAQIIEYK